MATKKAKSSMKAVVFAGGVGTRMWPLSRISTPKQFEKLINSKSTLQLTISRLKPEFPWENIYISTGVQYKTLVKKQMPNIPSKNIIGEPVSRDVAPAVGYLAGIIARTNPDAPIAILWSDHIMQHTDIFKKVLQIGGEYISKHKNQILFIGQKPRFANQNLGWIQLGKKIKEIKGFKISKFISWHYRPSIQLARQFFRNQSYAWNPGYFITTPRFILKQYQKFKPKMYKKILKLSETFGSSKHNKILEKIYPTFEKVSFDDAIIEKIEPEKAVVLSVDFGWSDIGNWQSLKEALQKSPQDNVTKGEVIVEDCENCIIHNHTKQLVTAIDIEGLVVVNTDDVLLVCTLESMKNIKKVVNEYKKSKKYKKYT